MAIMARLLRYRYGKIKEQEQLISEYSTQLNAIK